LEQLDAQSGGVEAALDWARRSGEAELALRLATAYAPVWFLRGRVTDGRRWLEAALLARARVPSHLVVRALREASLFARVQGQYETAHRLARVALHTAAGLPRPVLAAVALDAGELAARRGALASAESLDARSHALAAGDALAAARAECELAEVALLRGDADEARARGERALERQHQLEDE